MPFGKIGVDRRIPKSYSAGYFLMHPSVQQEQSQFPAASGQIDANLQVRKNLSGMNNSAFNDLLITKGKAVDDVFGPGANKWLSENLDKFEEDSKVDLYNAIRNIPDIKSHDIINGAAPPPNPNAKPLPDDMGGGIRG